MAQLRNLLTNENTTWINYIHYDLTNEEINKYLSYWNYVTEKNSYQINLALKVYDEKLKIMFQNNDQFLEQYVRLCADLKHNGLQQALDEAMRFYTSLPGSMGNLYNATGSKVSQLKSQFQVAKTSVQALKTFLAQTIALMENNAETIAGLQIDSTIKDEAIKLLPKTNKLLVVDKAGIKNRKQLSARYQNLIQTLQQAQLDTTSLIQARKNKLNSPIKSLFKQIHTLAGFVQEALIDNIVDMKKIKKTLEGHGYTITYSGAQGQGKKFNIDTSDFKVSINHNSAHIKLTLPDNFSAGVSIKRGVMNPNWKTRNIAIKTSRLDSLIAAAEGDTLTSAHRNSFYNLIVGQAKHIALPAQKMNKMYNLMSQALTAPALGGSLTNGDFAFLLAYNNKIMTIRDILMQQTINSNGKMTSVTFKPRLNELSKNIPQKLLERREDSNRTDIDLARERSFETIQFLNSQIFQIKLRLMLT